MTMLFRTVTILYNFIPILVAFSHIRVNLSGTDPIHLHNEGEVIFLTSLSEYMNNETKSWLWRFDCYHEFGFKVVIKFFDASSISEFYIANSTDIFVNKRSAKVFHPYYNPDNYSNIYLSQGKESDVIIFDAYLTLVVKNFTVHKRCRHFSSDGIIYWAIGTWASFIITNVHCNYTLKIPHKKEVNVHIFPLVIEKNVDFLQYSFDNNTVIIEETTVESSLKNTFTLGSYLDGREKYYLWEYIGDGSVPSLGTYISFQEIRCKCGLRSLACTESQIVGIMEKDDYQYCGNLQCTFKILPCNSATTLMTINFRHCNFTTTLEDPENFDLFQVYSNMELVSEINFYNRLSLNFVVFLNSSNQNTFEAITYPSLMARCLSIQTEEITVPPIDFTIKLESSLPYNILDSGLFLSANIESDIKNDTFILYSNREYGLPIFYDQSFSKRYTSLECFSDYFPYTCKITGNKLSLLVPPKASYSYYFPILSVNSNYYRQNGCLFKTNTFITKSNIDVPISVVATSEDYCVVTILISDRLSNNKYIDNFRGAIDYFYYHISYIWTNAKNETVKVFAGIDSFLFEFDSKTATKWSSIILLSPLYTIKVPKQTTIYLRLKRQSRDFMPIVGTAEPYENSYFAHIFNPNFYSLISTPFFGTSKKTYEFVQAITYYFGNFTLKFTVLYHKMSKNERVVFQYPNLPDIWVNKTGDTFVFKNKNITLQYSKEENSDVRNGAIFLVQVIN